MMTSNYWVYTGDDGVSIAMRAPRTFTGREFLDLAPKWWFLKQYKEDGDTDKYTRSYLKDVLSHLDPHEVYAQLGEDAVLLCWEKPGEFCHRRIVAKWLENALNVTIPEF